MNATRSRALLLGSGLLALGIMVYVLRHALTPIFFAFLVAYLLDPLVDRFEARRIPRAAGIVLVLLMTLGGLGVFMLLLVPGVVREVMAFADELPSKLTGLQARVEPLLAEQGIELPQSIDELRALFGTPEAASEGPSAELAGRAATVISAVGRWIMGGTASALSGLTSLLLVPVFAFYLLYDFDRMMAGMKDLLPLRIRPLVVDVALEVDEVLGQFVRGQLLVMLALALLYSVAYSLLGVRLAIPIGIVAGMLSFIPYVGGASALIMALGMCFVGFHGWWQILGVVVAYGVIQALEGLLITPRVVGDKVGLAAIWVLVALLVAGELFGFLGILLAVPVAAVIKIFLVRAVAYYRQSDLYLAGAMKGTGLGAILESTRPPPSAARTQASTPTKASANRAKAKRSRRKKGRRK